MILENKNFLVYGSGMSGVSAYNFLKKHNANVYMFSDKKEDVQSEFCYIKKITEIEEKHFDYVVVSPGVQIIGNKNIKKIKNMNINIISELELGYLFCKGKFIAVTGTNGKTTCVNLINHILSKHYQTFLCGNVGIPITSICDETTDNSVVVCEVSSFMLELISPNFTPDVAVITNITPDHISRHKTFDEYIKCKTKITQFQTNKQYLIIDDNLKNIQSDAKIIKVQGKKRFKTKLLGKFNQKNIELCLKACEIFNISEKMFKKELTSFCPVKFRLEVLGKKRGVTYINDSKSTNPDSTINALESINKKVVLLLGGSDKGNDFCDIFALKNIKVALIYGQTANELERNALFMGFTKTCKFASLNETLCYLNRFVKRGDIVLFSPACASYDEFSNYIERGEFFNKYFKEQ